MDFGTPPLQQTYKLNMSDFTLRHANHDVEIIG
ncbi:hypothetical protein SAMN05421755_10465 [Nitrosomonas sp. Nm33]|nr:hypothetical protein SAMN05421755_10465 [Nitrosomonas sp. Nm33]